VTSVERPLGIADTLYGRPYVDLDEWRDEPVRYRYVHGGFEGTECRFSYYFPEARAYQGRFFNPLMPVPGTEHSIEAGLYGNQQIAFASASGAYLVESNLGLTRRALRGEDSSIPGYRAAAAVATYSRGVAAEMYGDHRPYGYVYGGSGGAFRTMACFENAPGVWDGAVPFVIPGPSSLPNSLSALGHLFRVLGAKVERVVDALEPGGCGDPFDGLEVEERDALAEVIRLGFPPRALFDSARISMQYTTILGGLFDHLHVWDPAYFEEFWTVPGYLGASPRSSVHDVRIQHKTTVRRRLTATEATGVGLSLPLALTGQDAADFPAAFVLEQLPPSDITGAVLRFTGGEAAGHHVFVGGVRGEYISIGIGQEHFEALRGVQPGDDVLVDNSDYLAVQTYHRHQVPPSWFPEYDQFTAAGQAVYPQRPQLAGLRYERNNGAGLQHGRIGGKMIIVQTMMDEGAFPQNAHWYYRRLHAALGPSVSEHVRLWFIDHAMHGAPATISGETMHPARSTRVIDYRGVLEQALRDIADWVERDVPPPSSTQYEWNDGQIVLPPSAAARSGIQPIVALSINGSSQAQVSVGEDVELVGVAEVPIGAGTVIAAEWDFEGTGDFPTEVSLSNEDLSFPTLTFSESYAFSQPGTYFPALRVTSQRLARLDDPHARVRNLGRVRVVVVDT
jgi:hypothetical protein